MKRTQSFTPEELEELRRIDEQIDAEFEASLLNIKEWQFSSDLDEEAKRQAMDNVSLSRYLARKKYSRKYYLANYRQIKEKHKAYREANRDRIRERGKVYRAANRDRITAQRKAYREANRDKINAKKKAYYEANKDKISEKGKIYRAANRDKLAAKRKAYYEANKDKFAAANKAWHAAHKAESQERRKQDIRLNKALYDTRAKAYYEANRSRLTEYQKNYRAANKEKMAEYKKNYRAANKDWVAAYRKTYNERKKMGISTVKTNSHEEWLALRKKYIGGSDAAAVVNMNAFSSPFALWAEKTGKVPGFEGNLATEVGTFMEEFIARKFMEKTGKKVRRRKVSFVNSNYPWAIANIDREIIGEDAGLEIKFTDVLNTKKFKNGEFPDHYYVQCVHYLAVTGKKRWYLAVLVGNREFHVYTIERDEEEIKALMAAEETFWNNYVLKDTPPPTDGEKATTETISELYAEAENDNIIDLRSVREALDEYMEITRQINALNELKEAKANEIKALMGNSSKGTDGNYKVSWSNSSKPTFDAKRFALENPGIDLKPYYKHSYYRTFKVTEAGK